ncbi:hypothetical protein [Paenibacillus periandrae]|uniref:hypothetical protein n=1 Tax=Paenibacillus periandrae TaxID=1761741 RepID=UPI001F09F78C|nr:hypothetical protein [Paenibacillus periandrae]
MNNTKKMNLKWHHHLVTGTGISPTSLSYSLSVKEFLNQVNLMLRNSTGYDVELYLKEGNEGSIEIFLYNPTRAVNDPDGNTCTLAKLLMEHHAYPVEFPDEFANELIGKLFEANRHHVGRTHLIDGWDKLVITLLVKPKDRYFIVIHPSNDQYLNVFWHEEDLNDTGLIHLRDEETGTIDIWRHDALEISKSDYEFLILQEKKGHRCHIDYAKSVISKYLKGRSYRHFMDINPNRSQYRSIYLVSPLQNITNTHIEAFDEVNGELITLGRNRNFKSVADFCELSEEEYGVFLDIGARLGIGHNLYIEQADKTIHERTPVFGEMSRMELRNGIPFYPVWTNLSEGFESDKAIDGFIEFLLSTYNSSDIDSIMKRLLTENDVFEYARAHIQGWVNTRSHNPGEYQLTQEQQKAFDQMRISMSSLLTQCNQSTEFNDWLSEKKVFHSSLDDILKQISLV